jgi:hypothetical protein
MLSQPATNVWLKTKEPNAGEWVSKFIGKVEIERLRETHFDGTRAGRNFTLDRQVEPLVLESEISGLRNLHAYMKYENYVTRFSFPYLELPEVANDFELRHRPDEKLPYNPKELAGREADASASKLEQVPEHSAPTPVHEAPKTTETEPEIALPVVTHHPQNLIMRG